MKFEKAKNKLSKLAKGRYHSLEYEWTCSRYEDTEQHCRLYISTADKCWDGKGKTWDTAFKNLEEKLNPRKIKVPDNEAPIEEIHGTH